MAPWAFRSAASAFAQDGIDVVSSHAQCGDDAYDYAGNEYGRQRERVDSKIRLKIESDGQIGAQRKRAQEACCPGCENKSSAASENGEQQAFRQVLADQASATCSHRSTNAHFSLPYRGSHEQDIGDIETSNQKDQRGKNRKCRGDGRQSIIGIGFRAGEFFRE